MIFIADLIACSTCFGHHYAHHQTRHTTLSTTPYRQLENQASNTTGSSHLYNTLELLMMGIMVAETCWTSNKICIKNRLLHLVGILFPYINEDARSKSHQIQFILFLKFVTLLKTLVREANIKIPFLSVLCFGLIQILITFLKADFVFKPNGILENLFIDNNLNQQFLFQECLFFDERTGGMLSSGTL